jgi:hypothetical protein
MRAMAACHFWALKNPLFSPEKYYDEELASSTPPLVNPHPLLIRISTSLILNIPQAPSA